MNEANTSYKNVKGENLFHLSGVSAIKKVIFFLLKFGFQFTK